MAEGLDPNSALVLYSGGQDSATCLAWALSRFRRVETVGYRYGQLHSVELEVRIPLSQSIAALGPDAGWCGVLGDDHLIDVSVLGEIAASTLTGAGEAIIRSQGLPDTFVPGRNLVFLTLAGALAYRRGIRHIVTGVCETDYSGYPDCRDDTIKALQPALSLGMDVRLVIDTPLMWIDKAKTWQMAFDLGGGALVELIRDESHTCYRGDRTHVHDWGRGCGQCPACHLRADGWARYAART